MKLTPEIRHLPPDQFYGSLPLWSDSDLQLCVRSLAAHSDAPSGETASNWSDGLFGKQLEDLDRERLLILAAVLKATYDTNLNHPSNLL